jgi:hypothetical protein
LLLGKKLLPDPIFPDSLLSFLLSPFGGRVLRNQALKSFKLSPNQSQKNEK